MTHAHKTALLCFLVAGCAVQLSPELQLDNFSKDPDTVNVTGVPGVVTCDMTIPDGAGGAGGGSPSVVKYAACSFKSPDGRKQGCLATSETLDVWSCDVTIPADSEGSASPGTTWVLEYVFAESEDGAKLFATGAEIQADQLDGEIDLKVISDAADTTAPAILTFNAVPASVLPGSTVTCTLTTDEDPIELMGCSFVPDDASASVSCVSAPGANQCQTTIPAGATPGVTYNEINHFARDKALNVTVAEAGKTFVVGTPPATGTIGVDMTLLPGACAGASWSISPGGLSGTASAFGFQVSPGDYTITWEDTALGCTVPTSSPELKAVTAGNTTTFDLSTGGSTNYTTRSTFAAVNTDVGLDGNYGAAPPGGGAWTMEADLLPAQFAASGTGDVTGVVPSQGDFYVGRDYTLTWEQENDHTSPSPVALATSGTYQGDYTYTGAGGAGGAGGGVDPTGLVAHYEFTTAGTNLLDSSGNDNTLSIGDAPSWVSTVAGGAREEGNGAFLFDGSNYLVGSDAPFDLDSSDITLAAWVNATDPQVAEWGYIFGKGEGSYGVEMGVINGTGEFGFTSSPSGGYSESSVAITGAGWVHFAAVWDTSLSQVTLYVNGNPTPESPISLSAVGATNTLFEIGRNNGYTPGVFKGGVDEVWVYGRALSGAEIATLAACVPATCTPGSPPFECGTPSDGCGTPLACGDTCGGGETCYPQGTCCTLATCSGNDCGSGFDDSCGGTLDCDTALGTCDSRTSGDVCFNDQCCTPTPQPTACSGLECGNVSDSCGGTVNCGTCTGDLVCNGSNLCVEGGNLGDPYVHVYPADVGVTIGLGVTAPTPTVTYTGPNPITQNGTTVENVIINSCLEIYADNVTVRNVLINCTDFFGVWIANASNLTFENNKLTMALPSADKSFYIDENNTNIFIRYNDIGGGQDFFFSSNNNNEIYVEYNYMHDVIGSTESHADAFQWWPDSGNGNFYIRGNYIRSNNTSIGFTGIIFTGDSPTTYYTIENNNIGLWDIFPIRYHAYPNQFVFRYNVFEQAYKTGLPNNGPDDPIEWFMYDAENCGAAPAGALRCNRYEDGDFMEQQYVGCDTDVCATCTIPTHDISNCPPMP